MKNNKALQEGSHEEFKIDSVYYTCLRFAFFFYQETFTMKDVFPS